MSNVMKKWFTLVLWEILASQLNPDTGYIDSLLSWLSIHDNVTLVPQNIS
jgi:hypothetical protein